MIGWCVGCGRVCPGRDADGYCRDADRGELARRAATLGRPAREEKAAPAMAAQAPSPEPLSPSAPTHLHRFHADFAAWTVLLDGTPQADVWYAAVSCHLGRGVVQFADDRVVLGAVEIRPVGTVEAPARESVAPVVVPPVLYAPPVRIERTGQIALEW